MGDPTSKLGSAVHTGIGEGSVYQYIDRVADALYHHLPQVIRWPTGAEAARVSEALEVDGCIGVIDGILLPLATAPFAKERMSFYSGRKKMYCIWRRRDVYFRGRKFLLGDKGASEPSRSAIARRVGLNKLGSMLLRGFVSIGYAQSAVLIRSFNQTEMNAMSPLEQRGANAFNKEFASKHIVVEHAFGDIKASSDGLNSWRASITRLCGNWNDSEGAMADWIERERHGEPALIRPSTPEDVEFLQARDQQQLGPMAPRPNDTAIGKTTQPSQIRVSTGGVG
ncbi:BQ5605_C040g11883 [Microbotryum silenes-dioicae]|uniref:BQ5605_C040g11883 protein n=1 Tax=Microbotryum silenes-dioicae TaxID=796604 RepID=A0A2X0PPD7_9BASI|nr:BQ5605_C040g11883 [Microbotryum silenes-dioicae]